METINNPELTSDIIAAAITVHRELGPGFLESIYEEALCVELNLLDIPYERQKPIEILYRKCLRLNNCRKLSLPARSNGVVPVAMKIIAQQVDRLPLFVRDLSANRVPTAVQAAGNFQTCRRGGLGDQVHYRRIVC